MLSNGQPATGILPLDGLILNAGILECPAASPSPSFNPQAIPPKEAVRGLLARIAALTLASSGSFWHANGELLPW